MFLTAVIFLAAVISAGCMAASEEAGINETGEAVINNSSGIAEYTNPYAHVRFGEDRSTLLLDVEWHTYETYSDYVDEWENMIAAHPEFLHPGDGLTWDDAYAYSIESMKTQANDIKEGTLYISRTINGINSQEIYLNLSNPDDISKHYDEDGYYIFGIYPYRVTINYLDENDVMQYKRFGDERFQIHSRTEYEDILDNEIIPFCDELLADGLITQEGYDSYTIDNPLYTYADRYFK